jgi:hypothetical protein
MTMYSSNLGVFTVLGALAGLVMLSLAGVDVYFSDTAGEAISTSAGEFMGTLAFWTGAAAVEIVARGRRPWWDLWARAFGVALVALAAWVISFGTVLVAGLDGLVFWLLFGAGWIALMVRPMRRLLGPDAV